MTITRKRLFQCPSGIRSNRDDDYEVIVWLRSVFQCPSGIHFDRDVGDVTTASNYGWFQCPSGIHFDRDEKAQGGKETR